MSKRIDIKVGNTYNVKVYDSLENSWWESQFTVVKFIDSGTFAGAYEGYDTQGYPGIVEPEEFVSEV